jgi:hypothetical protein
VKEVEKYRRVKYVQEIIRHMEQFIDCRNAASCPLSTDDNLAKLSQYPRGNGSGALDWNSFLMRFDGHLRSIGRRNSQ